MPVDFVTDEQVARYGQYNGDPDDAALAKDFYLDADDWKLIVKRRGMHNRLGFVI